MAILTFTFYLKMKMYLKTSDRYYKSNFGVEVLSNYMYLKYKTF